MSTEEKGIRQMSGEPCGCVGESEQGVDRRAENTKRTLLQKGRLNIGSTASDPKSATINVPSLSKQSLTRSLRSGGVRLRFFLDEGRRRMALISVSLEIEKLPVLT